MKKIYFIKLSCILTINIYENVPSEKLRKLKNREPFQNPHTAAEMHIREKYKGALGRR